LNDFDGVEVFVISLGVNPRNPDLMRQISEQGMSAQIVNAIDGRVWVDEFDPKLVDVKGYKGVIGRMPTGPEVGCALSHMECASRAQKSSAEFALVFEEDAQINADLAQIIKAMRQLDASRPKVLTLYSDPDPTFDKNSVVSIDRDKSAVIGRFYFPPVYAVAYVMNRAAIDVYASNTVVKGAADWPPFADQFEFWGYYPWPVRHSFDGSMIAEARSRVEQKSVIRNSYMEYITNYLSLFRISKLYEHSRSLGGLRIYFRTVIAPHTVRVMFFYKKKKQGTEPNLYWVR
jgi:GR25 family glycosyltransferase involved in LPS biosynthesis